MSKSSTSMPSGASSCAARRSPRLYDALRRLPAIPRTRIVLRCLDGRDRRGEVDAVAEQVAAGLELLVPVDAVVVRVELALDGQADALLAPRVGRGALEGGLELDGARDAADGQVAGDLERGALDLADVGRLEANLGEAGGVEEVRRAQVLVALRLVRVDALGRDDTGRLGRAVRRNLDGALEVPEVALYGGDEQMPDAELDRRVGSVDIPGAGRDEARDAGRGCKLRHDECSSFVGSTIYLTRQLD